MRNIRDKSTRDIANITNMVEDEVRCILAQYHSNDVGPHFTMERTIEHPRNIINMFHLYTLRLSVMDTHEALIGIKIEGRYTTMAQQDYSVTGRCLFGDNLTQNVSVDIHNNSRKNIDAQKNDMEKFISMARFHITNALDAYTRNAHTDITPQRENHIMRPPVSEMCNNVDIIIDTLKGKNGMFLPDPARRESMAQTIFAAIRHISSTTEPFGHEEIAFLSEMLLYINVGLYDPYITKFTDSVQRDVTQHMIRFRNSLRGA